MSPEQKILVATYGYGDYAHMTDPIEAEEAHDTLFLFLMRELAPDGGTDRAEYVARLTRAAEEVLEVRDALLT